MKNRIFSKENIWALVISLIIILVFILTADTSPSWIYQGF